MSRYYFSKNLLDCFWGHKHSEQDIQNAFCAVTHAKATRQAAVQVTVTPPFKNPARQHSCPLLRSSRGARQAQCHFLSVSQQDGEGQGSRPQRPPAPGSRRSSPIHAQFQRGRPALVFLHYHFQEQFARFYKWSFAWLFLLNCKQ